MLLLYVNYNHHICYTTLEGFSIENMKLLLQLPCDDNACLFKSENTGSIKQFIL